GGAPVDRAGRGAQREGRVSQRLRRARRRGQDGGAAMTRMRTQRGFTLLEMMIAVAILSSALTWIVVGVSRNIKAENHAKLMTVATFLAREKMVDIEDELYEK